MACRRRQRNSWNGAFSLGRALLWCDCKHYAVCCVDRCKGTYRNYLSHVKLACQLAGMSTEAFQDDRLKRAAVSIDKRTPFCSKEKRFIRAEMVKQLVELPFLGAPWPKSAAMLFLVSYAFLLRVPSEGVPMVRVAEDPGVRSGVSSICATRLFFFSIAAGSGSGHQSAVWVCLCAGRFAFVMLAYGTGCK